jgi:hypothetical protein
LAATPLLLCLAPACHTSNFDGDGGGHPGDGGTNCTGNTPHAEIDAQPNVSGANCSSGILFAGDPTFNEGGAPSPGGQALTATPPVNFGPVVFSQGWMLTVTADELWGADMTAATPSIRRLAGLTGDGAMSLIQGGCDLTRFASASGLTHLSDGSIIIASRPGNSILRIRDPLTCSCTSEFYAGTSTNQTVLTPGYPPETGDADGALGTNKMRGPEILAVDDTDTVYFLDRGNKYLRKIAPPSDVNHTVTTIQHTLPTTIDGYDLVWSGMTFMKGKLYTVANSTNTAFIYEFDPTQIDAAPRLVFSGGGVDFPPLDSGSPPSIFAIANDGEALFLTGSGYVWYLTTDGVLSREAGSGQYPSWYPEGYVFTIDHSVDDLALPFHDATYMTWQNGDLYWSGQGYGFFVERIKCP